MERIDVRSQLMPQHAPIVPSAISVKGLYMFGHLPINGCSTLLVFRDQPSFKWRPLPKGAMPVFEIAYTVPS